MIWTERMVDELQWEKCEVTNWDHVRLGNVYLHRIPLGYGNPPGYCLHHPEMGRQEHVSTTVYGEVNISAHNCGNEDQFDNQMCIPCFRINDLLPILNYSLSPICPEGCECEKLLTPAKLDLEGYIKARKENTYANPLHEVR